MTINWKIWAPLGIMAVVALIIVGFNQFGVEVSETPVARKTPVAGETSQAPVAREERQEETVILKPSTGNVDDAVAAILAGISDDQALFADAEKDAALVDADSQVISDFGQSYNETEF